MMKVLKATQEQYEQMNGYQKGVSRLEFVKDKNGNWIVGQDALHDPSFAALDLQSLTQIAFVPASEES